MSQETTALTAQEVADILKITKNTVYEIIKRGELKSYKVGKKIRVDQKDVEAYINQGKRGGGEEIIVNPPIKTQPQEQLVVEKGRLVICGQDLALDILGRYLEQHKKGTRVLRSYTGSYAGIYSLYHGEVHVATAHMWDGDLDDYNLSYVRYMMPGTKALVYNLLTRTEGFYVLRGNPCNIWGWEDLKRKDIMLANREKGSGARILFDEKLRKMGIEGETIPGYFHEYPSHLAVASAVARGEAQYGLGCYGAMNLFENLEFIPLQEERYDIIIKKEDAKKEVFQALIEVISSAELKEEIAQMGGYGTKLTGQLMGET